MGARSARIRRLSASASRDAWFLLFLDFSPRHLGSRRLPAGYNTCSQMAILPFKAFLSQCYHLSRCLHDTAANNNWSCSQGNLLRQVKCPCQIDDISFKQKKSQNSIRVPSVWKAQKPVTKWTACFNKKHRPYKHVFTKNLLISSREDWSKEGLVCSFHPPTFIPEHPKQHRIIWGWMKRHLVNMKLSHKKYKTDKKGNI